LFIGVIFIKIGVIIFGSLFAFGINKYHAKITIKNKKYFSASIFRHRLPRNKAEWSAGGRIIILPV